VEIVMENPPFGTKVRHRDIEFLQKAFEIAPVVYSFHKTQTVGFLEKFAEKRDYRMTHRFDFSFPLKATQNHHKRRIFRIKVSCLRFEHPRG
jgi:putative methylase